MFRSVMRQVLLSKDPSPASALDFKRVKFPRTDDHYDVGDILRLMVSLLSGTAEISTPVRPLHASFYDFEAVNSLLIKGTYIMTLQLPRFCYMPANSGQAIFREQVLFWLEALGVLKLIGEAKGALISAEGWFQVKYFAVGLNVRIINDKLIGRNKAQGRRRRGEGIGSSALFVLACCRSAGRLVSGDSGWHWDAKWAESATAPLHSHTLTTPVVRRYAWVAPCLIQLDTA